jgi:hypothetical protein
MCIYEGCVRQMEIFTAEALVSDPRSFDIEIAVAKLENIARYLSDCGRTG